MSDTMTAEQEAKAPAKRKNHTQTEINNAIDAYNTGASLERVAGTLGVAVSTARTLLIDNDVVIRGRGRPRKN